MSLINQCGVRLLLLVLLCLSASCVPWGGLYPRESSSREVKSLDGLWDFRLGPWADPDVGFRDEWYKQPLKLTGFVQSMPVPCSYNEVMTNATMRDHVGWAWYDREFYIPQRWTTDEQRVIIRVGSSHYYSMLYINGQLMVSHEGGHLPYMADVTDALHYGDSNLVTIAINNTLTPLTIPQGRIEYKSDMDKYPPGYFTQWYHFDFFNYAGIHRSVLLYTTPQTYIDDVTLSTDVSGTTGTISYNVSYQSENSLFTDATCNVDLLDKNGNLVQTADGFQVQMIVPDAQFWWPYLMSDDPGYMYTLKITITDNTGLKDTYRQKVGIRKIGWDASQLTINEKQLYLVGCGKHEDSSLRGKGVDLPLIVKDFSLLKWLGANSFRTSHYPYAEEIMDMADAEGIMVIDEISAVDLTGYSSALLTKHETIMEELIRRDKNRPSVIMWSVANEPDSFEEAAGPYFRNITAFTRSLDKSRPVTAALNVALETDLAAASLDVIMLNRYYGWYNDVGRLELIVQKTLYEFNSWYQTYSVPMMISEYGAGTIPGIHIEPSFTWSEEYQVELMQENFKAFDILKQNGYFIGEMIWNFADFATVQGTTRVGGNKKGLFTRAREPKMSAHLLRSRYWALSNSSQTPPSNKFTYLKKDFSFLMM